jgi:hypothetical protein
MTYGLIVSSRSRSCMISEKPIGSSNGARLGHIKEAVFIAGRPAKRRETGLDALEVFGAPAEFLLAVALAHHGEPPNIHSPGHDDAAWAIGPDRNPVASIAELVGFAKGAWPSAFEPGGEPLPKPESPFWHAHLGLLQLADWIGSDEALDAFPFSEPSDCPRLLFARERARFENAGNDAYGHRFGNGI